MQGMVSLADVRHLRPVKALRFPASDPEWEMGEGKRHGRLCDLVYHVLRHAVGDGHSVGKDNFLYFDASSPRRKCAPDAFVKLDVPDSLFDSWRTWEHGAPELAVEILSPSDTEEKLTWDEKMERYHALGVRELASFNEDAEVGSRLRAWDRIEGDLVPRVVENETTPCLTLGLHWVIVPSRAPSGEELPAALRLARDAAGKELVPTPEEARLASAEAEGQARDLENARLRAELESLRRG
jgi:hypothetical protein